MTFFGIFTYLGNIRQLNQEHERKLEEFDKAQDVNKSRMEQGLKEKIARRRQRRTLTIEVRRIVKISQAYHHFAFLNRPPIMFTSHDLSDCLILQPPYYRPLIPCKTQILIKVDAIMPRDYGCGIFLTSVM